MNLCNDCIYSDWQEKEFYENADCLTECEYKILDKGNYVTYCSSYKSKNILKRLWNKFYETV